MKTVYVLKIIGIMVMMTGIMIEFITLANIGQSFITLGSFIFAVGANVLVIVTLRRKKSKGR